MQTMQVGLPSLSLSSSQSLHKHRWPHGIQICVGGLSMQTMQVGLPSLSLSSPSPPFKSSYLGGAGSESVAGGPGGGRYTGGGRFCSMQSSAVWTQSISESPGLDTQFF